MFRESRLLLLACALLLATTPALANDVLVDCSGNTPGAYNSFQAAMAALPPAGPNSIGLFGSCADNINIYGYSDLVIYAATADASITPANPNARLLSIGSSLRIYVLGISFNGGRGTNVYNSTDVNFSGVTIQGSDRQGLVTTDSLLAVDNSTITDNARQGIYIDGGVTYLYGPLTIRNSGRNGVFITSSAKVLGFGPQLFVQNNAINGFAIDGGSYVNMSGDVQVLDNASWGFFVLHTTSLYATGGVQVLRNGAGGIHIGETSHGEFASLAVENNGTASSGPGIETVSNSDMYIDGEVTVRNNAGTGIVLDRSSVFSSLGGNTLTGNGAEGISFRQFGLGNFDGADVIVANGLANLSCDNSSMVAGNLTGVTNIRCAKVEPGTGRSRAHALKEMP